MRSWSPLTWLVLGLGLLAVPYLWLTREGAQEGGPARRASAPAAVSAPATPQPPAAAEDPAATVPAPDPSADDSEPGEVFAAIVERPLFLPSRRSLEAPVVVEPEPVVTEPLPDPEAEPPVAEALNAPDFRLVGTLVDAQGNALAIVERAGAGARVTLALGDALDGWRLDSVGNGTIEVRQADQIVRIGLGETP